MVVVPTRRESHFVGCGDSHHAAIHPVKCVCKSFSIITIEMNRQNKYHFNKTIYITYKKPPAEKATPLSVLDTKNN